MDTTTAAKLIRGVGVIIDDEIKEDYEQRMIEAIQSAGIPVSCFDYIPDSSIIDSFGNISFIILDWEFSNGLGTDVSIGYELKKAQNEKVLEFLKTLLNKIFVPVFLITAQNFQEVKTRLVEEGLYSDEKGKTNRIMLKTKAEIFDYNSLIKNVQGWMESIPSVLVLKMWEQQAIKAKHKMFLEMYEASSDWVNVLLKLIMKDTNNNRKAVNNEFGHILTNNFSNRIYDDDYYDASDTDDPGNAEDIKRVLQGERYICYEDGFFPDVSYLGDLYAVKEWNSEWGVDRKYKYFLNIRAQCDLIREQDPMLYLIPGKVIKPKEIVLNSCVRIEDKDNEKRLLVYDDSYVLEGLCTGNEHDIKKFNKKMIEDNNKLLLYRGSIIERKYHSIVPCVANEYLIEFDFRNFKIISKKETEQSGKRIGRIIPPYITKIQNSFSSYIVREGMLPIPERLFEDS